MLTLIYKLFAILSFKIIKYIANLKLLKVTSFLLIILFILKSYIILFAIFIIL
jgi:hypothetical protein